MPAHTSYAEGITKGDNAESKKGRVAILLCDRSSHPVLHFYQIPSNYSEGYLSYRADTKSISKTKQREVTQKERKPELSFLYVMCHLVMFCISTNYHQNVLMGI